MEERFLPFSYSRRRAEASGHWPLATSRESLELSAQEYIWKYPLPFPSITILKFLLEGEQPVNQLTGESLYAKTIFFSTCTLPTANMDGRVDTVRTMQKYLDTIRSWFSRPRSDDEYTALHGDDGDFFSELPFDEHKRAPPERGCLAGLRPTPKHASDFFWAILPSFLARAFWHVDENAVIPAATKTSYLNGLRGVASMIVVFQHNTDDVSDPPVAPNHVLSFPFLLGV